MVTNVERGDSRILEKFFKSNFYRGVENVLSFGTHLLSTCSIFCYFKNTNVVKEFYLEMIEHDS